MLAKKLIIIGFGIITCSLVAMEQKQLEMVYSNSWMPAVLAMIEFSKNNSIPLDVTKNIFKQMYLSGLRNGERVHWVTQLSENIGIKKEDLEKMRGLVMLLSPEQKQSVSQICNSINCDFLKKANFQGIALLKPLTKEVYKKEVLNVPLWFRSKFNNESEVVIKEITIQSESKLKQILSPVPRDLLLGGLAGGVFHLVGANLGMLGEIILHVGGIRVANKDFFNTDSHTLNPSMVWSIGIGGLSVCGANMIQNSYDLWENPPKEKVIETCVKYPLVLDSEKEKLLKKSFNTDNQIECISATQKNIVKNDQKKNVVHPTVLFSKQYKKNEQLFLTNRE